MPIPIVREFIEFQGIRYYLDTDHYYKASRSKGRGLYHRALWEHAHGPIPPGWQVHHWDWDRRNNALDNLIALSVADHIAVHPRRSASSDVLSEVRHKQWAKREPRDVVCTGCGITFQSTGMRAMFCTKPCRRRWYRSNRGY